jgi:acyl carrier protein
MTWVIVVLIFVVAIAVLVLRDDRRRRRRRHRLVERVAARAPVAARIFAIESGSSLPLAEVTRIREIVAEYFQLDSSRVAAEDDVWSTYAVELSDELEGLMKRLREELGYDMADYDVERITTVGSIVRRCEVVGRVVEKPAPDDSDR